MDDEEEMLYGDCNAEMAANRDDPNRGSSTSAPAGSEGSGGKAEPTHWCMIVRENGVMEVPLIHTHSHFEPSLWVHNIDYGTKHGNPCIVMVQPLQENHESKCFVSFSGLFSRSTSSPTGGWCSW